MHTLGAKLIIHLTTAGLDNERLQAPTARQRALTQAAADQPQAVQTRRQAGHLHMLQHQAAHILQAVQALCHSSAILQTPVMQSLNSLSCISTVRSRKADRHFGCWNAQMLSKLCVAP